MAPEQVDKILAAARTAQMMRRQLAGQRNPLAATAMAISSALTKAISEAPATGCSRCGAALPEPTGGRGRPRSHCLNCRPSRAQNSANIEGRAA